MISNKNYSGPGHKYLDNLKSEQQLKDLQEQIKSLQRALANYRTDFKVSISHLESLLLSRR